MRISDWSSDVCSSDLHAADQLDIEMAHPEHPHRGFTADREGLRQHLVQRLALGDALAELRGLGLQLGVGECLHLRFERIDPGDDELELFEQAFVAAAEDAGEQAIEHGCSGWELGLMRGRIRTRSLASSSPNEKRAPGAIFGNAIDWKRTRSEEHTSELQSLMRISYAVFCLKKKKEIVK